MRPSELIKILQKVVDMGHDEETEIVFDTEARSFDYHIAEIGNAFFENGVRTGLGSYVVLTEK